MGIDVYNYRTVGWDQLHIFQDTGGFYESATKMIPVDNGDDYHDSSGNAAIRFYHYSGGNAAHDIQIDYVSYAH